MNVAPPQKKHAVRPRDAATLILLDGKGKKTKILLGKRHHGHKFMPGKYVFPGGRVEASDRLHECRGRARSARRGAVDEAPNRRQPQFRPRPGARRHPRNF